MRFASLTALVDRVFAWADGVQRRYGVLGFPYAVVKKYGDDDGGREAALITYYGFLSIFPLLLLGVAILSRVLTSDPELQQRLFDEIVPPVLRPTVEQAVSSLPTSTVPFIAGLIGLLFAGTGVVFSAYQTLNNVAGVPRRTRAGFFPRYIRVFVMLTTLLLGGLAVGTLTVAVTALPGLPRTGRALAALGSALIIFAVLLLGARLLLSRPAPVRALWPSAALGAAAVTLVLSVGPSLLARLVSRAGPVYGSFATVAGIFALLYLISQVLVYSAEVAAVRYAGLWPRALDQNQPTVADVLAMTLLAREQERIPVARVDLRVVSQDLLPSDGDPPHGRRQARAATETVGGGWLSAWHPRTRRRTMPVELVNPEGLPQSDAYAQVGVATGSRTVYVAGQVARTADGTPVGEGDLAAQVEQVFRNLVTALSAVGASYPDVAKLTIYVVDWTPDKMGAFMAGAGRAAKELGIDPARPTTLIGVAALAEPDLLVEVEAIAVLP